MSRRLDDYEYQPFLELGDKVSFKYYETKLYGEIVRVYNAGTLYHVEVDGRRYEVDLHEDKVKRI